jgi:hypothetical protein
MRSLLEPKDLPRSVSLGETMEQFRNFFRDIRTERGDEAARMVLSFKRALVLQDSCLSKVDQELLLAMVTQLEMDIPGKHEF